MSETAKATGQFKQSFVVSGERFECGYLTMKSVGKLQKWIDAQPKPDFVAQARMFAEINPDQTKEIIAISQMQDHQWPPQILTSPQDAMQVLLKNEDGWDTFVAVALGQARPDLKGQRIDEIAEQLDTDQFGKLYTAALGIVEKPDVEVREGQTQLVVLGANSMRDYARDVLAYMDVEADPDMMERAFAEIRPENYGSALTLSFDKGVPSVPKAMVGRGQSRKST